MSSGTALLLALAAGQAGSATAGITAEQAMAGYRAMLDKAERPAGEEGCAAAPGGGEGQIVVCGRHREPSQRLPLPDERGAPPGPRVALPGEIPRAADALAGFNCRLGCDENRLPQTLGKLFKILRGEDPDD